MNWIRGMAEIGVAQHPGKLEFCGSFVGAASRSLQRELARGHVLQGKYFDSVKHLGFLSSGRGDLRAERLARITSVRTAWYTFNRFWHAACPLRVKIIMFKCLVFEAAVSGWTAAAPSKQDTDAIDSIVLCFARKLLGPRALKKRLSQHGTLVGYSKVNDSSVWRLVRCVPVSSVVLNGGAALRAIFARTAASPPRFSARTISRTAARYRGIRQPRHTPHRGPSNFGTICKRSNRT
jgi:hypothetical protein